MWGCAGLALAIGNIGDKRAVPSLPEGLDDSISKTKLHLVGIGLDWR